MSVELWVPGVTIEMDVDGELTRGIVRHVSDHYVSIRNVVTQQVTQWEHDDLDQLRQSGDLKLLTEHRDFGDACHNDLTDAEQRETNRRLRYVRNLLDNNIESVTENTGIDFITQTAKDIGENPPHWQTVRKWLQDYIAAGKKMRGLFPKKRFRGNKKPKIDPRLIAIIEKESARYYSTSKPSLASIVRNIRDKVLAHNESNPNDLLSVPTYATVRKRCLAKSYEFRQSKREGKHAFRRQLASSSSDIVTTRILERAEIDHTELDIHVLDDRSATLLGRPYITIIIDHFSSMVLGFQISFEKPSFASVSMACFNAILPKKDIPEWDGLGQHWPAHGLPETFVTDNGNEFWGKNFIAVTDELGSTFQYAPIRKPEYKSKVERFFGVVNAMVLDDLPGVVRKPHKAGEGYDAGQQAVMTFSEFKRYFIYWLLNVYHNEPLENIGKTPLELWEESENAFPPAAECERKLSPLLMATTKRRLGRNGLSIFSLQYSSPTLLDLFRLHGQHQVVVKYDPFDIGRVYMLDESSMIYIPIDCENWAYADGLSLYEHKRIKERIRKECETRNNNPNLTKARIKLSEERDKFHAQNARRKRQVTRSKAARIEKVGITSNVIDIANASPPTGLDYEITDNDLDMEGWDYDN